MRTHVLRTAAGCFALLCRIKSIRRSVTQPVLQSLQSLVVALVLSHLDYGSTVLFSLPQQLVNKLQSVQNAAARLIFAARRRDHISPQLHGLHWLRVADPTVLHFGWRYSPTAAFTAQHLSTRRDNCGEFLKSKHVNDFVLRRPLLLLFRGPVGPPSAVDVSLLLRLQSGTLRTACQKQTVLQHL